MKKILFFTIIMNIFNFTTWSFAAEIKSNPKLFYENYISMISTLCKTNELIDTEPGSIAEKVLLWSDSNLPNLIFINANTAYDFYFENRKSPYVIFPDITDTQKEMVKIAKNYYDYIKKVIYDESETQESLENFKPSVEQLDEKIPSHDLLSSLFLEFLNSNKLSNNTLLILQKWAVFDCCDQVFSSLGTRIGLYQNEHRAQLIVIAEKELEHEAYGTWLCRPSVAKPDSDNLVYSCRTITFKSTSPYNILHLRIVHQMGAGYFLAQQANQPDSWIPYPSLVDFIKDSKKFKKNLYKRVKQTSYIPSPDLAQ